MGENSVLDEKTIQNIEYIKLNTKRMAEALEKIASVLNTALIDKEGSSILNFMNWNLGKLVAYTSGDKKAIEKIKEAEKKNKKED